MTVCGARRFLLFLYAFFYCSATAIRAWPTASDEEASQQVGGSKSGSSPEKVRNWERDMDNPNATLFAPDHVPDRGQRIMEEIYLKDKYFKYEVGFKWTGAEILCNCTTANCGKAKVVDQLIKAGYPDTCVGLACYQQKRIHRTEEGKWIRDEHMGCYGGEKDNHDIHEHHEPFFCTDTPWVHTRCCWQSFCQDNQKVFDYPDPNAIDEQEHKILWRVIGWGIGVVVLTVAAAILVYRCWTNKFNFTTKSFFKSLGKKTGDTDGFPLMDMAANRFSTPVYPHPYEQLHNESGGTSCGTEMTTDGGSHPLNKLLRDLDESETYGFSSGAMGNLTQKNSFLSDIRRLEQIGQGRYGTVYKCLWKGQVVAVKVLISRYEHSYYREVSMYRSGILRHTNILQFLGNDIIEYGNALEMCMVFEYHELGSLDNYLFAKSVSVATAARMIFSMASGLAFLHSGMEMSSQNKPAIAHRDLKSGNILVKKNLMVCISDLGLAVCQVEGRIGIPKPSENDHFEIEYKRKSEKMEKCGTMRYLSPELLDDSFDCDIFESYKAADVYSLGLVMYEVCRRTVTKGEEEIPYEKSMPYFRQIAENGGVVGEVDFTIMKKVIVDDKERPDMCDWWSRDPILGEVTRLMVECWQEDPQARLSANNLVRSIERTAIQEGLDISQT